MEMTKEEIIAFVKSQGADLCGIADLSDKSDYIKRLYGEYFSSFPRAVSFAIFYPKDVLQRQLEGPTRDYFNTADTMNKEINAISLKTAKLLERAGFRAYPVTASDGRPSADTKGLHQKVSEADDPLALPKIDKEYMGDFSHRLAAAKAGLGWVGKSCSIINPEVGPCLRLGTILTDAPFVPDSEISERCGSCTKCKDICPVKALHGRTFNCDEDACERYDAEKCTEFVQNMLNIFGSRNCALCLAVCPWGK